MEPQAFQQTKTLSGNGSAEDAFAPFCYIQDVAATIAVELDSTTLLTKTYVRDGKGIKNLNRATIRDF